MSPNASSPSERPIFLLGSERSGTNLVRAIMGSHPNIDAPAPLHLLRTFGSRLPEYGNLAEDANFRRLCGQVATALQNPVFRWNSRFSADELERDVQPRTFMGLFDHIYSTERQTNARQRTFFKENDSFSHAWLLLHHYPDAKFIFLTRDGRDVATSWLRAPTMLDSVPGVALNWSNEQRMGLHFHALLRNTNQLLGVRYEDLTQEPERAVRALCDFVGEDFVPTMLDFHKRGDVSESAQNIAAWKNIGRPILQNNAGAYRHGLSKLQIFAFERIAYRELKLLGYPLESSVDRLRLAYRLPQKIGQGAMVLQKLARGVRIGRKELDIRTRRMKLAAQREVELDSMSKPVIDEGQCVW